MFVHNVRIINKLAKPPFIFDLSQSQYEHVTHLVCAGIYRGSNVNVGISAQRNTSEVTEVFVTCVSVDYNCVQCVGSQREWLLLCLSCDCHTCVQCHCVVKSTL